jgi:hypothetical protein
VTRRTFSLLPAAGAAAAATGLSGAATPAASAFTLANRNHRLEIDPATGQLLSLRPATGAIDQEFIEASDPQPAFVIQYLDSKRQFRTISSRQASTVTAAGDGGGDGVFRVRFAGLAGLDLEAEVTVQCAAADPFSRWGITVTNRAGLAITAVEFPFVIVRYRLGGAAASEALLRPFATGQLHRAPQPHQMSPDNDAAWQFRPDNGDAGHYPGLTFAQLLAYYNDRAGLYAACDDTSGGVKLIKAMHRGHGIRLGFSHVGDWPANGTRELGYNVLLCTFTGDWYDAAELYRAWSLQQAWANAPLHRRTDIPAWLMEQPPHIVFRIQGELDAGPVKTNAEFVPYPKIVPLAQNAAARLNAPVLPVIMSWESGGPWVYPDCFPPAGGDESLKEFTALARQRGWHVGTYCNGTRWVTGHYWNGYDGQKFFDQNGGEQSVCRTHDGLRWQENWDRTWRPSYACCAAAPGTVEIARAFVGRLIDDGLDWIQFLDQNVGCATFPCFSAAHGHPPTPGRWMTEAMGKLLDTLRARAATASRPIAFSIENAPNENFIGRFDICDIRVTPPGHTGFERSFLPLWHYLFHEFTLIQGTFGSGPDPYYTATRNAYNLVTGAIPGAIITGSGRILNREAFPWAQWVPQMGSDEDSWRMFRTTTALRRSPRGRDFLAFGRMQRPVAKAKGMATKIWIEAGRENRIPAVFHGAWRDPAGRFAIVAANWTSAGEAVAFTDSRLGTQCSEILSGPEGVVTRPRSASGAGAFELSIPALSCLLLEQATGQA